MKHLVLALLAISAPSAEQFDLICQSRAETIRYRVDLAAGEWCWETCFATWKIAQVTSTRITFKDQDTPSGTAYAYVDRITGAWRQSSADQYSLVVNEGTCKPAPFTGFGAERAKF